MHSARFLITLSTVLILSLTGCSPDLRAPQKTFVSITGETLSFDQLKGKVVLVNFWATSCTGCIAEMPHLMAAHHRFANKGYETVAIAMSYDRPDYVINFTKTRGLPFKIALDHDGKLAEAFGGIVGTPTSFLLDKQGRIIQKFVGAPDFAALDKSIEQQLAS